jgi:hypothetical protein
MCTGQNYTIRKLYDVDLSGGGTAFYAPAINDEGTVALLMETSGSRTIMTIDAEGVVTPIAEGGASYVFLGSSVDINNSGQVAFWAQRPNNTRGIFSGDGSSTITIAEESQLGGFVLNQSVAINNAGFVAFATGSAVVVGDGGPLTFFSPNGDLFQLRTRKHAREPLGSLPHPQKTPVVALKLPQNATTPESLMDGAVASTKFEL